MKSETNTTEINKQTIKKFMDLFNLTEIKAEYNGAGDSGAIDHIDVKIDSDEKFKYLYTESVRGPDGEFHDVLLNTEYTVENFIETFCFDALTDNCGGWEIDDGSQGTFKFTYNKEKDEMLCALEHCSYISDTVSETYTY